MMFQSTTKYIITFILFVVVFKFTGQTTLKGYVTQYEHGDTVINCKVYHQTLHINKNGKEIHNESLPLSTKESTGRLDFETNQEGVYINGSVLNGDTVAYKYITDTLNGYSTILKNKDTLNHYEILFDASGRLQEAKCIQGCEFIRTYTYSGNKTLVKTQQNDMIGYDIIIKDDKGREIESRMFLNTPEDTAYAQVKTTYKDQSRMKIERFGHTHSDDYEVHTTFYDKKQLPVYYTIEFFNGSDKKRWVIEYEED